jgi:Fe-S cluster assembly protein SufD
VKCAHGATTGRLDENMLFYLLARGIDRAAAQTLLIYAFLDDLLTGMSIPGARHAIEEALIAELPGADLLRAYR